MIIGMACIHSLEGIPNRISKDGSEGMRTIAATGAVLKVKVMRYRGTGQRLGFAFLECFSRPAAQQLREAYNGKQVTADMILSLNWAVFSGKGGSGHPLSLSFFSFFHVVSACQDCCMIDSKLPVHDSAKFHR